MKMPGFMRENNGKLSSKRQIMYFGMICLVGVIVRYLVTGEEVSAILTPTLAGMIFGLGAVNAWQSAQESKRP